MAKLNELKALLEAQIPVLLDVLGAGAAPRYEPLAVRMEALRVIGNPFLMTTSCAWQMTKRRRTCCNTWARRTVHRLSPRWAA